MTRDHLRAYVIAAEGTGPIKQGHFLPYWDCCGRGLRDCRCVPRFAGKLTIGYGQNIEDNGLDLVIVDAILDRGLDGCIKDLVAAGIWFADLDAVRQSVLVELCFNLGITKLRLFQRMILAVTRQDYPVAAKHLLDSKAARDAPTRYQRLAKMLETGDWV